ncbi:MAG: hypothetical protein PHC53_00945 [Patescibacteria group bacterium]|nr:hypothetical protein [Patescibacteria group bacterium]
MINNQECLIIFDPEHNPLGEILFDQGACRQINLNQAGEDLIGNHITDWQTNGLDESVTMQAPDFEQVFLLWLQDHGYLHLTMPLAAMIAWSEIQQMDIEQQKKYELAVLLRDLPVHKLTRSF